jgi:formylglycine-generating enzyme required for sulfatase activity
MSGESPDNSAMPYPASIPAFALAETETSRAQWSAFLAANPDWMPERRDSLVASGDVNESYLADWNDSTIPASLPVTGVSRNAALAYCAWLSRSAPQGFAVVLPSESMWEAACKAGAPDWKKAILMGPGRTGPSPVASAGLDRLGFADLVGNVWEWCSDTFFPFPALAPDSGLWKGAEFSVRGASWANSPDSVSPSSRGGFPASFSSPFLGFRPALVMR